MKKRFWILALLCLALCGCSREEAAVIVPETTAVFTLPAVTETAPPETAPALPIVITKDPTDETLSPGGRTWFVAHADNAVSVRWEFFSPEGVEYSAAETAARNPGLVLDGAGQDTLSLEKIPLSMNGWACRACFTGPGGSAVTALARITVKQSQGVYDSVIARYQAAAQTKNWAENGVSEMIAYASHVGYAKLDLDGNGVEELIIAGIGYDIPEEPVVFEIFTVQDNAVVSVCQSYARSRLFLMSDGKIYNEGSSGAAYSNFSLMALSGTELRFLNGIYTTDLNPDGTQGSYGYYYTTTNQYGTPDQMAGDTPWEEKVAQTFLTSWRNMIYLPELCYIG